MHVVPVRDADTKISLGLWDWRKREERWEEGNQHLLEYLMLTWHLMVFSLFMILI